MLNWTQLAVLTDRPAPAAPPLPTPCTPAVRIAVARDEAFCFAYAETLDALRDAGAELAFFSPLRDAALPENIGGLYLPGGYPELYARQLSENIALRAAIRDAGQEGLPTAAECGGFLYLGQTLEGTDSKVYPMTGVLPGSGHNTGRLVRFGYAAMTAKADSMLSTLEKRCPSMNSTTGIPPRMAQTFLCAKLKKAVGMRLCKRKFVRRFPASLLGWHCPAPPLCAGGAALFETQRMTK